MEIKCFWSPVPPLLLQSLSLSRSLYLSLSLAISLYLFCSCCCSRFAPNERPFASAATNASYLDDSITLFHNVSVVSICFFFWCCFPSSVLVPLRPRQPSLLICWLDCFIRYSSLVLGETTEFIFIPFAIRSIRMSRVNSMFICFLPSLGVWWKVADLCVCVFAWCTRSHCCAQVEVDAFARCSSVYFYFIAGRASVRKVEWGIRRSISMNGTNEYENGARGIRRGASNWRERQCRRCPTITVPAKWKILLSNLHITHSNKYDVRMFAGISVFGLFHHGGRQRPSISSVVPAIFPNVPVCFFWTMPILMLSQHRWHSELACWFCVSA